MTAEEARVVKNLDAMFKNLIAEIDNVNPEDVTPLYILDKRQRLIYPDAIMNIGSSKGLN